MRRREFLGRGAAVLATAASSGSAALLSAIGHRAPSVITSDAARPAMPCGIASGDVTRTGAIVWSRTDRPAWMIVEYATKGSFLDARRIVGPMALDSTDFTARVELRGLPPGQRIVYRVSFQALDGGRSVSVPVEGSFRTPSSQDDRDVSFAFSADVVGQGWGIDPSRGGLALFDAVHRAEPDVFVHLGDSIYADQPLQPEVVLDDGSVWRNVVTEAKSKVAQTLADFRGAHSYNLQDEHLRRLRADVPQIALWDDHEVRDNWYPTQRLDADNRYAVKSVALLAGRAKRAFFDYHPIRMNPLEQRRIYRSFRRGPSLEIFALDMRTYRGANSANRQTTATAESAILGGAQVAWLKSALAASSATWKVIAADLPLGLVVPDGRERFEAVANRDAGLPLGRELEIADLLKFIRDRRIRNVVWITADVHYAAVHHYDPSRATFTDFSPFWEFVAGPAHAGTFGPNELDPTFGPEVRFLSIPPQMKPNRPPSDGLQFFGFGRVDRRTGVLTMQLRNRVGQIVYATNLEPNRG